VREKWRRDNPELLRPYPNFSHTEFVRPITAIAGGEIRTTTNRSADIRIRNTIELIHFPELRSIQTKCRNRKSILASDPAGYLLIASRSGLMGTSAQTGELIPDIGNQEILNHLYSSGCSRAKKGDAGASAGFFMCSFFHEQFRVG
jgi:hypothetical protein